MFETLLSITAGVVILGMLIALDGSRDIFHPMVFIGPMLAYLYVWMPSRLLALDGLRRYFDSEQMVFLQGLYLGGILAFIAACLSVGVRLRRPRTPPSGPLPLAMHKRLVTGAAVAGAIGLGCWIFTIVHAGGFLKAFSASSAGWDDSGYLRDGSLLMLVGVLLSITSLSLGGPRLAGLVLIAVFGSPWIAQMPVTVRRGSTFAIAILLLMGWYMARRKRPPLSAMAAAGFLLAWIVLFLAANRQNLHTEAGWSDGKTGVSESTGKPDTSNEYVYGGVSVLDAQRRGHYLWTAVLESGVVGNTAGWKGERGVAPGLVAGLFIELGWLSIPALAGLGLLYGFAWKRAVTRGGPWTAQYAILSALSIYMIMRTIEAVVFPCLLLSLSCWLTWRWVLRVPVRLPLAPPEVPRSPHPLMPGSVQNAYTAEPSAVSRNP